MKLLPSYDILLIDDDDMDRKSIIRNLKEANNEIKVTEASTAKQGLAFLEKYSFNCVLLDYFLPTLNGLEFIGLVDRTKDLNRTIPPIVMLTGKGDEIVAVRALKTGVRGYEIKNNVSPEKLSCAIENAIKIQNMEEENIKMQAELKRSNADLSTFARAASHDLKAPLRHIMTFSNILLEQHGTNIDNEMRDYLEKICRAGENMKKLIDSMLNYSKVGGDITAFENVDLNILIKSVVADLKSENDQVKAQIYIDELPLIEAEYIQIYQVFHNLITNAVKYSHKNVPPVIRITSQMYGKDPMNEKADGRMCWISVQDNGIGFDEKYIDQIYLPFHRLVGASEYEGSGIGLATVKRIIERHNGDIEAHSILGSGSTFIVKLPLSHCIHSQEPAT